MDLEAITRGRRLIVAGLALLPVLSWSQQQQMSRVDRGLALEILQVIASDVRKHYYDPKFQGVDFDAKVAEAKQQIAKANSFNMSMSDIASALDSLNDSHTFFFPPEHAYQYDIGLLYQMIGDRCFVMRVRPKSDAEAKGVKAGDEILTLNGYSVNRRDLWKMQYVFEILRPQPTLRLGLQDPTGVQRQVDIAARIRDEKRVKDLRSGEGDRWNLIREGETEEHLMRARYAEYGDQLLVLKVPKFNFSAGEVDNMMGKARKHANLIIDLRGNLGGSVETLKYLVGGFFDKEVKVADRSGRKEFKPQVAKPAHHPFTGKLVVLVDSRSASAAEVFARVIQLEKRGVVMGDRSAGAVMEARHYDEKLGTDTVVVFGVSITESDLIMADGKSLEHTGVTPDELALPDAEDLAKGLDPVLAHAADSLGVKVSPEDAGKAFPYEWAPE